MNDLDTPNTGPSRREFVLGAGAAWLLLVMGAPADWIGAKGATWQFVLGVGMACAVTALPILILLMQKLEILRTALGQRLLRYASLDDILIWGVLALILLDWERIGRQGRIPDRVWHCRGVGPQTDRGDPAA